MISIVTVVRNDEKHIRATLESVLSQKTDGIEYIVIDGASSDRTSDIVAEYRAAIDHFISEPDAGIYDALNKGIRAAKGSLIGIAHSGDKVLPGVFSAIAAEHAAYPGSILYGCIKTVRDGVFDSIWGWNADSLTERMIPHPAAFVPAVVFRQYGLYDPTFRIAGDYEAFLRFYLSGVDFRFMDLIVQEFDLGGASQTNPTDSELRQIKEKFGLWKKPSFTRSLKSSIKSLLAKSGRK